MSGIIISKCRSRCRSTSLELVAKSTIGIQTINLWCTSCVCKSNGGSVRSFSNLQTRYGNRISNSSKLFCFANRARFSCNNVEVDECVFSRKFSSLTSPESLNDCTVTVSYIIGFCGNIDRSILKLSQSIKNITLKIFGSSHNYTINKHII